MDLGKKHKWHLFLSHIWGTGQDQCAGIKRHSTPTLTLTLTPTPTLTLALALALALALTLALTLL